MENNKPFSIKDRLISFKYAFAGLRFLLVNEHNTRIHFVATILVFALGFVVRLAPWEWVSILFAIGLVWAGEAFNTAIEFLANRITTEKDEYIRIAKDVAAGATLIFASVAVVVGLIIFLPKICIILGII